VDGDERVEARSPAPPDDQLLVLERLQVGAGQLLVIVNTATAPACLPRLPDRIGVTPPVEPVEAAGTTVADGLAGVLVAVPDPDVPVVADAPLVPAFPVLGLVAGMPAVPVPEPAVPELPMPVPVVVPGMPVVVVEVDDPVLPVEPVLPVVDPVADVPVVVVVLDVPEAVVAPADVPAVPAGTPRLVMLSGSAVIVSGRSARVNAGLPCSCEATVDAAAPAGEPVAAVELEVAPVADEDDAAEPVDALPWLSLPEAVDAVKAADGVA
jgi:hypothetical protein